MRRSALLGFLLAAVACNRTAEQSAPAASRPAASASPTTDPIATADRARIRGDSTAPVWMREISDFQCPYCKTWHDASYDTIVREYVATGKVRLAYVNFPLQQIHPNANAAAEAAMCAGTQGRFWEMHDQLFSAQDSWAPLPDPTARFVALAAAAGADSARVRSCLASHATQPLVQADHDRASEAGVRSTPTFLIDDRVISGAAPTDEFRRVLDAAIAAHGAR